MKTKKQIVVKILMIILLIGVVAFGIAYRTTYGFTKFDYPSPKHRVFDSLEELKEAAKGKYLFPSDSPKELIQFIDSENYVLDAGNYSGLGNYLFGYGMSHELARVALDESEKQYLIRAFSAGSHNYGIIERKYVKQFYINGYEAKFYHVEHYHPTHEFTSKVIRLYFIGLARKNTGNYVLNNTEDCYYSIQFNYICDDPEIEKELIDFLENELIKIAESMIQQGLPSRK